MSEIPFHSTQTFMNRLRMLQSNTNRLSNQHQALLPLLPLLKLIPQLSKQKQTLSPISSRLSYLQHSLKQFTQSLQHSHSKQQSNNLKQLTHQITEVKKKLKEVEEGMKKGDKEQLFRTKIRTIGWNKEVEGSLEGLKKDVGYFIGEFKEKLGKEWVGKGESEMVEQYIEERFKESQIEFEQQMQNVKRQMGLLQCEIEYLKDKQLRKQLKKHKQLSNKLKTDPKQQKQNQTLLASTQYNFYFSDFSQFQQSNTDRLKYQLQTLQNDIKRISSITNTKSSSLQKKSLELSVCKDKYHSLINQIEGSKWKKREEIMRLENKLERLRTMEMGEGEVEKRMEDLGRVKDVGGKHGKILEQYVGVIEVKFKEIQKYL